MSAPPNRNSRWARALVEELARGGVDAACVAPGSRSTPLTVALAAHDEIEIRSHLDERSAAYFALGRGRRTGRPTPVVCTSGTAAANLHPAVLEADRGRVPLLLLTADRPPELGDSGANQTVDQEKLYGDAVRWYRDVAEPAVESRPLRSLRTTAARALGRATDPPAGPVHLNLPFSKPLEPTPATEAPPADLDPRAADGRPGDAPYVRRRTGAPALDDGALRSLARDLETDRGLLVAGPADPPGIDADAVAALAHATGFPLLADPLSGLRFSGVVRTATVLGGYDGFLHPDVTDDWPDPEVVLRLGASPTSKPLRSYLARTEARQLLVDPAGGWREAAFAASDLVTAAPSRLAGRLARLVDGVPDPAWTERWTDAERRHWAAVEATDEPFEGRVLAAVAERAPEPTTLFVSNSMPVRDLDRFGRPSTAALTVLGNRGASGIDGIVSTALGAGDATTDHLTLVLGDLAYYHDMNGLLALGRCGVDATVVLIDNDGGGIFHTLPIEDHDPPFTEQFRTPHGLDFAPTADIYELCFRSVAPDGLPEAYAEAVRTDGTTVLSVAFDAESSHRTREAIAGRVVDDLAR